MPKGYGYGGYGGPKTKRTAHGTLGGGAGGPIKRSPMRQNTTGDMRYQEMERPMFHDSDPHGHGKGPWPRHSSGKGNGGRMMRY